MLSFLWPALLERWRLIEDLGFDSARLPDHFVNPRGPIDRWFDAWTLLPALAASTTRVRIGTLVTTISSTSPARAPRCWTSTARPQAVHARQTFALAQEGGRIPPYQEGTSPGRTRLWRPPVRC